MTQQQKDNLYDFLTAACQNAGFCTDATYAAIHDAIDSIIDSDPDEPRESL